MALSVGNNGQSTAYSGVLSGSGSLVKIGAGLLTLNGPDTYAGGTTLSNGTLQLGNPTALGAASGGLTVNSGVLDLQGQSPTCGSLGGAGGTILTSSAGSTATLTVNMAAGTTTYNGVLANGSGTLALTKNGPGACADRRQHLQRRHHGQRRHALARFQQRRQPPFQRGGC